MRSVSKFSWILSAALAFVLTACGEKQEQVPTTKKPVAQAGLEVGITEPNANFLWSREEKPTLPNGFETWRDRLSEISPSYYRLTLDWSQVQPEASNPPNWEIQSPGCVRSVLPCSPYLGVREQLQAIASQQRHGTEFKNVLVVPLNFPTWATEKNPSGCVRPNADPRSIAISESAVPAYKKMIRSFIELAKREGVHIKWYSPWNEPNHPGFISPQRDTCSRDGKLLAPVIYTRLARALKQVLTSEPGDQQIELGELAGYVAPRKYSAGAVEFLDELPDDVVCSGDVWGQHAYVGNKPDKTDEKDFAADADAKSRSLLLAELTRALDQRKCSEKKHIWITETGVGGSRAGATREQTPESLTTGCRAMSDALIAWYDNPRVDVAFQYTFREDDLFPVGLVDPGLTRTYPTFFLWKAWGGRSNPAVAPPLDPC